MHSRNSTNPAFFFILFTLLTGCASPPTPHETATPTTQFSFPLHLPDMPLHDPWIVAHVPTHTYYLYTTNQPSVTGDKRTGTMVYRSQDLLNWQPPVVVFTIPNDCWADPSDRPWAPEVHEYQGKFYLFTTLHNQKKIIAQPPSVWRTNYMRGTVTAVSDSPLGPFKLLNPAVPIAPPDFMTLDGTFYLDPDGKPWMVYAHEWIQKIDGTMEAIPLNPELSAASGKPIYLFKGSDAPWFNEQATASKKELHYVTDGPELFRTHDNHLLMLWSAYDANGYVETIARSKTGRLEGPWEQLNPLLRHDSGHGMLFHTFDGQLMLILHHPFKTARGKLYEIQDAGDHLEILRHRTDLDLDNGALQR